MDLTITASRQLSVFLLGVLLLGCSSKPVEVQPELSYPTPVVEPLPVKLAAYFTDAFKHYRFEHVPEPKEKKAGKKNAPATPAPKPASQQAKQKPSQPMGKGLRMSLGTAQLPLLSNILKAQFAQYEQLEEPALREIGDADLLLESEVLQFQYSSPRLTKLKVYEVWIKYRFSFYDRDDVQVLQWDVPVYGKTPTAFLKSDEEAFEAATEVALRDLGAAFVTGLPRQPAFQQWLSEQAQEGQ